jgi:hypothetical protein
MSKPKEVKIGNRTIKIEYKHSKNESGLNNSYGYAEHYQNKIVIDKLLEPIAQKEVLLHEIFHFIKYIYEPSEIIFTNETKNDYVEHHYIYLYTANLINILKNNPEVANFILNTGE